MIRRTRPKLWQLLKRKFPKIFKNWHKSENPYHFKLIVHCDICKERVDKKYLLKNWGATYGEVNGKQLCPHCYELNKLRL